MRKLPNTVLLAIANYFIHRDRQSETKGTMIDGHYIQFLSKRQNYTWDKEADLAAIGEEIKKYPSIVGWGAVTGTFFFTFKNDKKSYAIHDGTFPNLVDSKSVFR